MTESQYRIMLRDIRAKMCRDGSIDSETYSAASDWMRMTLAEMEREKQNTRRAGRMSLRTRLRILVGAIVTQRHIGVKPNKKNLLFGGTEHGHASSCINKRA